MLIGVNLMGQGRYYASLRSLLKRDSLAMDLLPPLSDSLLGLCHFCGLVLGCQGKGCRGTILLGKSWQTMGRGVITLLFRNLALLVHVPDHLGYDAVEMGSKGFTVSSFTQHR